MGSTWLASREDVALALDLSSGVRDIRALDRHVASATDLITRTGGYPAYSPSLATKYLAWPMTDDASSWRSWRLYLGRDIFASIDTIAVGASAAAVPAGAGGWAAYPRNRAEDEPIRWLELDRSGNASWSTGSTRSQDQVVATGIAGWSDQQATVGTLEGGVTAGQSTIDLAVGTSRLAAQRAGVGNQLLCGNERMIVVDREAIDMGENLGTDLDAYESVTIRAQVPVASGAAYCPGEVISIDAEDMLIERIRGNTLFVRRGWGGTTLAEHATGADIYAWRRLVVERGAAGTTAASHADGAAVTRWVEPPALNALCIALAVDEAMQVGAAYGRTTGTGDAQQEMRGNAIKVAWSNVAPYMRKGRVYAV